MNESNQWEPLARYFLEWVGHPRYGAHAREMFKLLLLLREEADLKTAHVQADYLYITLRCENVAGCVEISNETPGFYTVSLRRSDSLHAPVEDDRGVALEYVSALAIYHLMQLSEVAPLAH